MPEHHLTLTLRRKPWFVQLWRKLRHPGWEWPTLESGAWWDAWFAVLVPYRWRSAHRAYAQTHRYYWMPCVLCDRPYGGHETLRSYGKPDSVPDPLRPGGFTMICPVCTRAGRGVAP